jgi:hypothetical protein
MILYHLIVLFHFFFFSFSPCVKGEEEVEGKPKMTPLQLSAVVVSASAFALYVLTVRLLRYRRVNRLIKKYGFSTREGMAGMTTYQAWEIQKSMHDYDFPFTMQKSLEFALFKTYGIPSISRLLVRTKQLVAKEFAAKVCGVFKLGEKEFQVARCKILHKNRPM